MRVLVLSASIGMGHMRAAQALEHVFRDKDITAQVRHEDALQFANAPFRNLYQKAYFDLVKNAPELLGLAYDYSDKAWEKFHYGMALERLNTRGLIKLVDDYRPDVVISTHSLPADLISWLICKRMISCQHAIVITDFDIHPVWLCHHYSRYFVALEETREHMVELGFDRSRVIASGIPVDPVFRKTKDKFEMRRKYDLDSDKTTILISAGGLGMGPVEEILSVLMKLKGRNQIIAVCGANSELHDAVNAFSQHASSTTNKIKVVGLTSEIDEYMSASDLILGKPGGLTASEALVKGLVSVIVSPVPGQEERNADHLLEEGVAIRCNNLPTLAYKIESLLNNPKRLETMRKNVLALAKPYAADDIVVEVISSVRTGGDCATYKPLHACERARAKFQPYRKPFQEGSLFR